MTVSQAHQELLQLVSSEPLKRQFAELFLKHCTERMLAEYTTQQMVHLLEKRFAFFMESLEQEVQVRVIFPEDEESSEGRWLVDVVCRDAPFSVITVDSVLREEGVQVVRRLHPMIAVRRDAQGQPEALERVSPGAEVYDVLSIELQAGNNRDLQARLKGLLERHLWAVRCSARQQPQVTQFLDQAAVALRSHPEADEQQALIEWFRKNLALFGAVVLPGGQEAESFQLPEGVGILSSELLELFPDLERSLKASLWELPEESIKIDRLYASSPILRFEPLMRVSVRLSAQEVLVLVGLLKRSAQNSQGREVPVIRQKQEQVLQSQGFVLDTFDYNEVFRLFAATPMFELFRASEAELVRLVDSWLSVHSPHQVHAFRISDRGASILKLLLLLPNRLFSEATVEQVRRLLKEQIPHQHMECFTAEGDEISRVHLYFSLPDPTWEPNLTRLEHDVARHITPWEERLRAELYKTHPGTAGVDLYQRYLPLMPAHYRSRTSCEDAVRDIEFLERLPHESGIAFNLVPFAVSGSQLNGVSLLYIYSQHKLDLLLSMPVLQNLGLHVFDQLTARIGNDELTLGFVQSFRVQKQGGRHLEETHHRQLMIDLLKAVFQGRAENDPLNGLLITADLSWQAIHVLQLYRNLLLQLSAPFSRETINATLLRYPAGARLLVDTFMEQFDPDAAAGTLEYRRKVLLAKRQHDFRDLLQDVEDLTDDVVLRRLFNLIEASLRTNFFIPKKSGDTFISVKLDSQKVDQMPVPAPFREIYVHDVGMEGTHLRFGAVARGGLRWSDRPDDFRTEILGLVKTQQTKNVVIVPVGSKGGFVVKGPRKDDPEESQRQYCKFISALLDVTDTRDEQGQVRHPNHVLAHDGPDPYLVVAADKGTATFSDTANAISASYGFWLDDAFASGGSNGYDHKKVGITARGAWECVKLHFREMGRDIQTEPFTAIGVGDMSGDVFGNGMLLSPTTRLQAAFNHLHIFLDPDPEAATSWEERQRLFQLPRSTWKDYDREKLSPGGGIYDRKAKAIALSPQAQALLGLESANPTGEEVVQAILKLPADLLWLGGIGTYVKTPVQTHYQVGDQANDTVRINSDELQVKVVGEGANLGLTQLARIDCSNRGIRLNTDAIDNSAGVNMSDYEVNLKVLLQHLRRQGHLDSMDERNALLHQATEEVAELLLANNRGQHRLLSMDALRSQRRFRLYRSIIPWLRDHGLNVRSEYIPGTKDLDALEQSGLPMPRPVLAIMQAYVKMNVYEALLHDELLTDPVFLNLYLSYLPESLKQRFGRLAEDHPLRQEITATVLTNAVVNQAGCVFYPHLLQTSNFSLAEVTQVYFLVDQSLRGPELRAQVEALPEVSEEERYRALIVFEDAVRHLVRSLLQSGVRLHSEEAQQVPELLTALLGGQPAELLATAATPHQALALLHQLSSILEGAPDVTYLNQRWALDIRQGQSLLSQLEAILGLGWMREALEDLKPQNEWELQHQDLLLRGVDLRKRRLLDGLLAVRKPEELEDLESLLHDVFPVAIRGFQASLEQIRLNGPVNLTTLAVLLNQLETLESALS